jgi:opacity protein-like surface antigen
VAFVLAFVPAAGHAQTRWDVAGSVGLFAGYRPRADGAAGYQDQWRHNVQVGATIGRHLTPHLKLELEGTATNGGRQFRERVVTIPGYPYPYPIGSEVTTSVRSIGAALTWQFRENEWVHPFVQAGIATDFDRVTVRTWEQFFHGTPRPGATPERLAEEHIEGPTTTRHVRAIVGGGAKLYVSEAAFVRTDGRWSFDPEQHNLAFRLGFGVDF